MGLNGTLIDAKSRTYKCYVRLYAAPLFLGSLAVPTLQSQLLYSLSIKLPPGETENKQRKSVKNLGLGKNPQTNKKVLVKDRRRESIRLLLG